MLFVFSVVAHGFAVAGVAGEAGMTGTSSDTTMTMASPGTAMQDGGMACGGTDCSGDTGMHMACFAHCAALTGIVTEPVSLPMPLAGRAVPMAAVGALTSLHGPPDPHPPKPTLS